MLAFDATHRKIRYNTPLVIFSRVNHHNQSILFSSKIVGDEIGENYIWLLENLMVAISGKRPLSVINDGDLAMINEIKKVFHNAHHRLCACHLIPNATSNIKTPKFVSKFRQYMLGDFDLEEFQRGW